jgi:hypothetical protein
MCVRAWAAVMWGVGACVGCSEVRFLCVRGLQ